MGGEEMKRRKLKAIKGDRPKLHQGGVVNESQRLNIDDVTPKVKLAGRRFATRLVDNADPYNLRGR
jgi:hypothetical protein